jgi:uncharacterized protein (DUF983 family)
MRAALSLSASDKLLERALAPATNASRAFELIHVAAPVEMRVGSPTWLGRQPRGHLVRENDDLRFVDASGRRWEKLPPTSTGPFGRCPRCGKGHIFTGFLTIRDRCEVCGLDYSYADPADGPAVFAQLFACVPGVIFTLMLEILASPPFWVHLVTSLPILAITTVLPLRPIKGWLVASQFYFKAEEGRLAKDRNGS